MDGAYMRKKCNLIVLRSVINGREKTRYVTVSGNRIQSCLKLDLYLHRQSVKFLTYFNTICGDCRVAPVTN